MILSSHWETWIEIGSDDILCEIEFTFIVCSLFPFFFLYFLFFLNSSKKKRQQGNVLYSPCKFLYASIYFLCLHPISYPNFSLSKLFQLSLLNKDLKYVSNIFLDQLCNVEYYEYKEYQYVTGTLPWSNTMTICINHNALIRFY